MSESIEFGISLRLLSGATDEARRAEMLGYDYLLTGEHIMFHGPVANNLVPARPPPERPTGSS